MDYPKYWKCVLHIISHISFIHAAWAPKARRLTLKMQTLDDPPHFKIWPYLISFSFLFLKIFPRCYIPIFDGLVRNVHLYWICAADSLERTVPLVGSDPDWSGLADPSRIPTLLIWGAEVYSSCVKFWFSIFYWAQFTIGVQNAQKGLDPKPWLVIWGLRHRTVEMRRGALAEIVCLWECSCVAMMKCDKDEASDDEDDDEGEE